MDYTRKGNQDDFSFYKKISARLVCVFKNWKLLSKNICGNTCGWKSVLKCVKYCLKTENGCLKIQTKHPVSHWTMQCTESSKIICMI